MHNSADRKKRESWSFNETQDECYNFDIAVRQYSVITSGSRSPSSANSATTMVREMITIAMSIVILLN